MTVSGQSNEEGIELPTSIRAYNKRIALLDVIHEAIDIFGIEKEIYLETNKLSAMGVAGGREVGAILGKLMNGKILIIKNVVAYPPADIAQPDNWLSLTYEEYIQNDLLYPVSFTVQITDEELFKNFITDMKALKHETDNTNPLMRVVFQEYGEILIDEELIGKLTPTTPEYYFFELLWNKYNHPVSYEDIFNYCQQKLRREYNELTAQKFSHKQKSRIKEIIGNIADEIIKPTRALTRQKAYIMQNPSEVESR